MNYCNSMTEKQKISCLSHKEDPDGIISAVLIKHLSRVLVKISEHKAATVIGLPRIDPELSINKVTTVSLKSIFFSLLKV